MYYLLLYEVVDDYLNLRAPFRKLHLEHATRAKEQGHLVMAGAFANPVDGAALVFKGATPAVAEEFAKNDPYVINDLITSWQVREWTVVIGGSQQLSY